MLDARGLTLKGITTDGSHIYSEPVANVFGQVKHQLCRFHIIKEITRNILKVVTQTRRQLKQKKTKRPRGRPCGQQAKQIARKNQQVKERRNLSITIQFNICGDKTETRCHPKIRVFFSL
jgi:hypothetical protein